MKNHHRFYRYAGRAKARLLAASAAMLTLFALSASAFAIHGDMSGFAALRHDQSETRAPAAADLVRIAGQLSCDLGKENDGQGCDLKFKENGSGKIYHLKAAESAMRSYLSGNRNVTIEGRLADAETLEVKSITAL